MRSIGCQAVRAPVDFHGAVPVQRRGKLLRNDAQSLRSSSYLGNAVPMSVPNGSKETWRSRAGQVAALASGDGVAAAASMHRLAGGIPVISTRVFHVSAAVTAESQDTSHSTITVGDFNVQVDVAATPEVQVVRMETDVQCKLLLHWGVEGGKDYKAGWRLPAEAFRPVDTVQYKDRALQTRFQREGDIQVLEIRLEGDEVSDNLNFVFKEEASGIWYDSNGTNFVVPLKPMEALREATMENAMAVTGPLPELPNELCGVWAYIKWESAGCPHRSQEESDLEYRNGIKEMQELLRQGVSLEDLRKVAKGEIPYPDFMASMGSVDMDMDPIMDEVAEQVKEAVLPSLPVDLINTRAYMTWIENGRPDGADYGQAAREWLEARLRDGSSVGELEKEVYESKRAQDMADNVAAEEAARKREEEEAARSAAAAEATRQQEEAAKKAESKSPGLLEEVKGVVEEAAEAVQETVVEEVVEKLPELPVDLINTRAYMIWVESGRPNGADFGQAAREWLEARQREGSTVAELEKEVFESRRSQDEADKAEAEAARKAAEEAKIEAEAANRKAEVAMTRAYLMWVESGRPDGANFDKDAREWLDERLKEGRDIADIEEEVVEAKKAQDKADAEEAQRNAAEAERAATRETKSRSAMQMLSDTGSQDLGSAFVHQQYRNPMELIKAPDVPLLSADKDKKRESALEPLVQEAAVNDTVKFRRVFPMGNMAGLLAVVSQEADDKPVIVELTTDTADKVVLHWGVSPLGRRNDWLQPEEDILPEDSVRIENGIAAETTFTRCDEEECNVEVGGAKVPLQRVSIELPPSHGLVGLQFVIRSKDSTRWWKDGNSNFVVRVPGSGEPLADSVEEDFIENPVALQIVKGESSSMWTLMHRYNMVADILNQVMSGSYSPDLDVADATAHLYVLLRYSANRHITWQRNYNTQPRILSAAQDRLTRTIAEAHGRTSGEAQEWVRLMLGMLGRGGDGQKIRDEILNIMHRNNIKEVKGTWMEEWHQKLHNNTTPDDVGICEAYLAFLRADGDNGVYWRVLSDHGITRARLESFDRAIRCEPEDYPGMRGNLIGEFENYLGILKAVHSGTDLQTSAQAAAYATPESAKGFLGYVLANRHGQVVPLLEAAVEARTEIRKACTGNRELIYLDLALEDVIRGGAERAAGSHPRAAIRLVGPLLQNLCLTAGDNEEICFCLAAWLGLPAELRSGRVPTREQALQAAAVVDRTRIALADISDSVSARIEPISTALGNAFGVEEWASELFAEEVVRGGPAFAVSQVLGNIEAGLRSAAELSAWQVISPGGSAGIVRVEHDLYKIQDDVYDDPTILVIDRVTGEEEIPEGTVAVLTPDAPDVLSHVSVRARNMNVLFATCHDDGPLMELRSLEGKVLEVSTTAAGEVNWTETNLSALSNESADHHDANHGNLKIDVPKWIGKYAVGVDEFKDGVVGAKSKNIAGLRGKLPEWINLPASVTIPFGSFETALDERECRDVKKKLDEAVKGIKDNPSEALHHCREIIMGMTVPEVLKGQLSSEMQKAGMEWPDGQERWEEAFQALKGVWASKFNERAYYSMRKAGLPFMDLRMAVLVMRVVPAQYAFVIHTMNPSTRDETEVYCELVKGLGETLVSGQFTGKSMAFSASKSDLDNPKVLSYPSKSAAMFVRESLIFRSDSNGEDLEGYAGAGLYDSITMDPCVTERIDYTQDKMLHDEEYRRHILSQICKVRSQRCRNPAEQQRSQPTFAH